MFLGILTRVFSISVNLVFSINLPSMYSSSLCNITSHEISSECIVLPLGQKELHCKMSEVNI